jgi:hypothetical protein
MGGTSAESGKSVQERLHRILESRTTQWVLLAMLAVDILAVISSGFLETAYLESKFEDSEAITIACIEANGGRRLGGSAVACALPDHYGNETLHSAEVSLIYVSVVILGLFLIEHALHMFASFQQYFSDWKNLLDLFVVVVSMSFEVSALLDVKMAASAGAIALARLWRFARIVHGTAEVTEEIAHEVSGDVEKHEDPEGGNTGHASSV